MLVVLLSVLGLVAVLAWCFALYSLIQLIALAPAGHRFSTLFSLGWWQFDKIKAVIGPAADPHVKNYVRAFIAFFFVVIGLAVLGVFLGMEQQNATGEATAAVVAPARG